MSKTYHQQAVSLAELILRHAELVTRAKTAIIEGEARAEIRKAAHRESYQLRERRKHGRVVQFPSRQV